MSNSISFREFPVFFRFSRAYHDQRALLSNARFWTEKEAASHLGVTPEVFREGVKTGIYPLPVRFGKQTQRWIMSEIIAISGYHETIFAKRKTFHELQVERKENKRLKNQRYQRIIDNRNNERGRRELSKTLSSLIQKEFRSENICFVTVYLPQYVLKRDDLVTLDIPSVFRFTRTLLDQIGLGNIKAVGGLDIIQIAYVGSHKKVLPTWHVHVHLYLDCAAVSQSVKDAAKAILSEYGPSDRAFHCAPVTKKPVDTMYLLKTHDTMSKRLKPPSGPLFIGKHPIRGRDSDQILNLMGYHAVEEWVYLQNMPRLLTQTSESYIKALIA